MKHIFFSLAILFLLISSSYAAASGPGATLYSFEKGTDIHSMIPAGDGGWLLLGTYFFNELNYDVIVMKVNSAGAVTWRRVIGETKTLGSFEGGVDLIRRTDGTIVVVGGERIYQLNAAGTLLRKEEFKGGAIRRIVSSPDGGYYLAGDTEDPGDRLKRILFLTKVNAAGLIDWTRTYRHPTATFFLTFLRPVISGYLLGAVVTGNPNTHLLKVSASGEILWQRKLRLPKLVPLGYAGGDKIYLADSGTDKVGRIRVIRLSQSGSVMWSRQITSGDLRINAARIGPSGGMIIVGDRSTTPSSAFLLNLSSAGKVQSLTTFPGLSSVESIFPFQDHAIVLAKQFNSRIRGSDAVFMETRSTGEIPGCFKPAAITYTVTSPSVPSGSSGITTSLAEATLTPVDAIITPVNLTVTHICP